MRLNTGGRFSVFYMEEGLSEEKSIKTEIRIETENCLETKLRENLRMRIMRLENDFPARAVCRDTEIKRDTITGEWLCHIA